MANADNRRYVYGETESSARPEYPIIAEWIPLGARILDLGCGDGALLHYLQVRNPQKVAGLECAPSGVEQARKRGLSVEQGWIDQRESYRNIADNEFDVVICNVTLQMVLFPEVLVTEMRRLAPRQILSFPNFGHLFNRLDLLLTGRMPRPQLFGYQWYNTGQIHQLGLSDFHDFCRRYRLEVEREYHGGRPRVLAQFWPGLFSRTAIYLTKRVEDENNSSL